MSPRRIVTTLFLALALAAAAVAAQAAEARGWLGLALRAEAPAQETGVPISAVAEGSPAAKAGIKAGDTLLAVDGAPATSAKDVADRVGTLAPGTVVKLRIMHEGEAVDMDVTLGTRPGNA